MNDSIFPVDKLRKISDDWDLFWQGKLDRPMVYFGSVFEDLDNPIIEKRKISIPEYPAEMSAEEIIDIEDAYLCAQSYVGDTYPCFQLYCGPGNMSAYLGARLEVDESIWFFPTASELADVPNAIDKDCHWYKRLHDVLRAAKDKWTSTSVQVMTSDLGQNFDVLAELRGSAEVCMDMMDDPELVKEKLCVIFDGWKSCYQEEHDVISSFTDYSAGPLGPLSKTKTARIQSDFSIMISNEMYDEFVFPSVLETCEFLGDPYYHLDGVPQLQYLDQLLKIDKLRGIEFVSGAGEAPPKEWTHIYKKILDAGKQHLIYISVEDALALKKEMGTLKGFALYIGERLSTDRAEAVYRQLI